MLLPSLGKAREKARLTQCTNNLKQTGMAVGLYQGDFKDYFPPYDLFSQGWPWGFMQPFAGDPGYYYHKSKTLGYLPNEAMQCPMKLGDEIEESYGVPRASWYGYPYDVLCLNPSGLKTITRCYAPSQQYVFLDGSGKGSLISSWGWKETFYPRARHLGNIVNIDYADNHVAGFRLVNVLDPYGPTWKSALPGYLGKSASYEYEDDLTGWMKFR